MMAVSALRSTKDEREGEMESFFTGGNEFPDFSCGNLLESIDFDDLFVGIEDGDLLPDLEMDSNMLAEFSSSGGEEFEAEKVEDNSSKEEGEKVSSSLSQGEEIVSKREVESVGGNLPSRKEGDHKGRKSSAHSKNPQGKRKLKVDWTPELHRRFVQAVEQLGVDKAVPSRILEIMGIDCLTRHNIASHLQKYRSHRKHLLAREAEAASWTHRRQMYGGGAASGGGSKIHMGPWVAPTMGFPPNPMTPPLPHFRPLHVWGHPSTVDQPLTHTWPKHLIRPPPPPRQPAAWAPPPTRPPPDPQYWHSHHHRAPPNPLTPGTPYFQPPMATTRFPAVPLVHGVPPPHALYRVVDLTRQNGPHPPFLDLHPSKESIDSAIGDVLSKPWLPLPLGLKPPSLDGVMVELQRQGIPKIPPSCA